MGVLRIHFTSEDLARTTVAEIADPLWEIVLSRFRLHDRSRALGFRPWIERIRADRAHVAPVRTGARLLAKLAPMGPYFPDFLTPQEAQSGLDAGLEAIRSTPRTRLRREIRKLASTSPVPAWGRSLADGDPAFLGVLGDTLRRYHESAISPHHDLIQAGIDADRARRANGFLRDGIDGLLATMAPIARWRPPVLEVNYDLNRELHLNGRGLRLVPSFFSDGTPDALADPDLTPVLVYPIDQDLRWPQTNTPTSHTHLEALIGTTRAAVLDAIDYGTTTTQLARRLHTSPASVSRHTTVLRNAGLITSHRDGNAVIHMFTPLGNALLDTSRAGSNIRPTSPQNPNAAPEQPARRPGERAAPAASPPSPSARAPGARAGSPDHPGEHANDCAGG